MHLVGDRICKLKKKILFLNQRVTVLYTIYLNDRPPQENTWSVAEVCIRKLLLRNCPL